MVALQLFVALVVLLTLDGAQPQGNVQCAYENKKFCRHVWKAHLSNMDAKMLLKKAGGFDEDWIALLDIDALLILILKETDKADLFANTVLALKKEAEELVHLNATCTARGWVYVCYQTTYRLVEATVQLVEALKEVAEEEAKTIATNALDKYSEAERNRTMSIEELVGLGITLGSSVSKEIYSRKLIKLTPKSQL